MISWDARDSGLSCGTVILGIYVYIRVFLVAFGGCIFCRTSIWLQII